MNIYRFAASFLAFLILPVIVFAQASPSPAVTVSPGITISPSPSIIPTPIATVIGRAKKFSFSGDITQVNPDEGTIVVNKGNTPVTVQGDNAQIIKKGAKKNSQVSVFVIGDHVSIDGMILPDGTYMAQHIKVFIKSKPKAKPATKKSKSNANKTIPKPTPNPTKSR
jgi:hypothetical protein